jgi:hypothetical protein
MPSGFVYVLVSPNSDYIKIGGTEKPLIHRLRSINGTPTYAEHGPWEISDFLQVTDWQLVEGRLHRHFQKRNVRNAAGTRELFDVPAYSARKELRRTDPALRIDHEQTQKLFKNLELKLYLYHLFELTGLFGSLDIQEAWTLRLFPSTLGGRWFTLNIGRHEVAFSPLWEENAAYEHCLVLDRLILEYPETVIWIGRRKGAVDEAQYKDAERAVIVRFWSDFAEAEKLFKQPGVRRATVAYWLDSLARLRESKGRSPNARYHQYDAVAELLKHKRAVDEARHGRIVI